MSTEFSSSAASHSVATSKVGSLFAVLCAAAIAPASATPDIEAIVPSGISSARCDVNRDWTLNYVADVLKLDALTLARVKLTRSLSNVDLCTMADARIQRTMVRALQPKPDHPGELATFREGQRKGSDGSVDPQGLSNAINARDQMVVEQEMLARATQSQRAPFAPLDAGINSASWTSLGPGNIGGRVRTIATVPGQPNTLYAGSVGGGIWKTTNGGAAWNPVLSFGATISVSSIVINPLDPAIMYVGTGEGFYNYDAIRGAGVYKTTNGGSSWYQLSSASPATSGDWSYVNRLTMHPTNPAILFAATGGGIYRTTDSGVTWTKQSSTRVLDVKIDATNPLRVVAGRADGRIERSIDGGATFTNVFVPATAAPPTGTGWGRVEVAWARSTGRLYAAVTTSGTAGASQDGRVYFSADGGATWTPRATPFHMNGQGWYNNAIWVDPTNENLVIVGGLDNYRSNDGGLTFIKVSRWNCAPIQAHADNHAIVESSDFDATTVRTVYWGNDGGIYKAANIDTLTAQTSGCPAGGWTNLNNGLGVTQFLGVGANTNVVYGGTQDNGSLKWSGTGTNWSTVYGGDGGASTVDPLDANYLYGEYVYLAIHRATSGNFAASICNGIADAYAGCITNSVAGTQKANFISPIALDPNNSSRLYGGAQRLWVSTNVKAATPTWSVARVASPSNSYISAVTVAPTNSEVVYVGHNDGRVYKSTNAVSGSPSTWSDITCATSSPTYPVSRAVVRILVDPNNANIVYVGHGGYSSNNFWKLDTTGAAVCSNIGTALPPSPVRGIARHPTNATWLYAGTEVGLFASENLGATWRAATDGPANVSVEDMVWQPGNKLVVATHGRGVFRATVGTAPECSFSVTPVPVGAPASGGLVSVDVSAVLFSCVWGVSSSTSWITPAFSGGSGSARLGLTIAANPGTPRAATITVAGTPVLVEQTGAPLQCSLDIDGDTAFNPAIDGVLLVRYAMGFRGTALINGLTFSGTATRTLANDIVTYMQSKNFDIDGDGSLNATDVLLALRGLNGITGDALLANALSAGRTRSPAQIQTIVAQCLK